MLINKITTGFVIQTYDTDKKEYSEQEFFAGDEVNYELPNGESADWAEMGKVGFGPHAEEEPYLPFDMVQPSDIKTTE